jgi:hypothetical protein
MGQLWKWNFFATKRDWKLQYLPIMKNLMVIKPQKRNFPNSNHRLFSSHFAKSSALLAGHSDFIEVYLHSITFVAQLIFT